MEQKPYTDANYRTTMRHLLVLSILTVTYSVYFSLWKREMTMEKKTMITGCISWGVLVRQRGMWTPNSKALPRHPLKSQIWLFWPVQPVRFYLFIFFFISLSHFCYFSLFPDLVFHSCPSSFILTAPVHCRLSSPANGANPHLPLYLQLLPSRKQDTQMAERPPSCKGAGSEMRFREQKAQRSFCFGLSGILDIGKCCTMQQCCCTATRQRRCIGCSFWETPLWVNMW